MIALELVKLKLPVVTYLIVSETWGMNEVIRRKYCARETLYGSANKSN